jgi:L-cysteine S-thiosulfotransferase
MNGRIVALAAAAVVSAGMAGAAVWSSANGQSASPSAPVQIAQASSVLTAAGSYMSQPVTQYEREGKKSGFLFATPETQDMQKDDDDNPSFLWIEHGAAMWTKAEGAAGKSCMDCHGPASKMRGVGATYPKVSKDTGKLASLEHQINYCRTERMKAPELKWETQDMLGISTFVMHQSRGLPMNVSVEGPAKAYFDEGEQLYNTRRGQLNVACVHCHELNSGNYIRADLLSEGRANGFPLYRLKWARVGSFHYRMEECYSQVRATPEPYGSDELTKLQLYVAWRSNGLLIETPGVRR